MQEQAQTQREYVAPEVEEVGSFESLTQGPGAGFIDVLFGANGGFQPTS